VPGSIRIEVHPFGGRHAIHVQTATDRRRGALARRDGEGIASAARMALKKRIPLVLELASSGADVSDGIDALHGWGGAAAAVAACSGIVPIVAVATGPVISGPALLLGIADLVIMTPAAVAFVSGPSMVAAFTGVRVALDELGGTHVHSVSTGLCTIETTEPHESIAEVLRYLPDHADLLPRVAPTGDPVSRRVPELLDLVPARDSSSYDVRDVLTEIVDDRDVTELWPQWARQLVTAFARLGGHAVGIVANQPSAMAGTLDIAASQKGARFVGLCDSFNLPIVTLVDTPGFLPGKDLEWRGMIRHGAELVYAYASASVPRLCVIMRKAFGGAYIVMDSRGVGNDLCVAWPGAEIAVMGAPGAVQILHRRASPQSRASLERAYREELLTPWPAADRGFVDDVIDPAETRAVLAGAVGSLAAKREMLIGRKHGNEPM
jgi:acetyl-CoA carboxylase carboxyltransferase component